MAGGPCVQRRAGGRLFDMMMLGEGELQLPGCAPRWNAQKRGIGKKELLRRIARIEGCYVPSFYGGELSA